MAVLGTENTEKFTGIFLKYLKNEKKKTNVIYIDFF